MSAELGRDPTSVSSPSPHFAPLQALLPPLILRVSWISRHKQEEGMRYTNLDPHSPLQEVLPEVCPLQFLLQPQCLPSRAPGLGRWWSWNITPPSNAGTLLTSFRAQLKRCLWGKPPLYLKLQPAPAGCLLSLNHSLLYGTPIITSRALLFIVRSSISM